METKDFQLKIKGLSESGDFTAYAAVYGEQDLQGDVIERGAFNKAIREQGDGFPLLWSHKQDVPIGLAKLEDSQRGPIVHGSIDKEDPDGAIAYRRVQTGVVKGISIGFSLPNQAGYKYVNEVRRISELRLHELSLVAIPAQPGAQILTVKQLGDAARLLKEFPVEKLSAVEIGVLKEIQAEIARLLPTQGAAPPGMDASILEELKSFAAFLGGRDGR